MTARHVTHTPPCAACEPLPGNPTPGEVLRAAAETLPVTDAKGFLLALSHKYDTRCTCHPVKLRDWNGGYGRVDANADPGCPVHGEAA